MIWDVWGDNLGLTSRPRLTRNQPLLCGVPDARGLAHIETQPPLGRCMEIG
jgi:hypothetical protein